MKPKVNLSTKMFEGKAIQKNQFAAYKFGFFFSAPATHHLYYLLPLVRVTKERIVIVFNATEQYLTLIQNNFPDINFISLDIKNTAAIITQLNKYSVLVFANTYHWFVKEIQPNLSRKILLTRILHGASHKFADDRSYYLSSVFGGDVTIVHGAKDLDMFYDLLDFPRDQRSYADIVDANNGLGKSLTLMQCGNLRAQDFFSSKFSKTLLMEKYNYIDPNKKTILVMPTHTNNPSNSKVDYSSLTYLTDLLEAMEDADEYNFLFKLHPNLIFHDEMRERLIEVCNRKNIRIPNDLYTADYFSLMSIADIMVTDRSSSVFDFLYFDKPIVFLDSTNEYLNDVKWNDLQNPFWSFQLGAVLSIDSNQGFSGIIKSSLSQDNHKEIRKKVIEYAFRINPHAGSILAALLAHPKLRP